MADAPEFAHGRQTGAARAAPSGHRVLALAALVLGAAAMGISPIFVRFAEVGPYASAFWRVGLALPVLWLWAASEAGGPSATITALTERAVVLAGAFFAGDLFFWHLAILNTTVANATFLATMAPVWVVLGSGFFIREPVARRTVAGLGLCIVGAVTLIGSSYSFAPERLDGDLFGTATSMFFGAYFLAVRVARRTRSSARIMAASSVITAALLLLVALLMEERLWPESASGITALVALALISHFGGQGLLAYALGHLPAAFSALVIFLEAVFAAAFGWMFVNEPLSAMQVAGGLAIVGGIVVAHPRPSRRPAAQAAGGPCPR